MNTLAPEFSALMTIFGSVGPVISTRRSCNAAGSGATRQSPLRMAAVSSRKSGRPPRRRMPAFTAGLQPRLPARFHRTVQRHQQGQQRCRQQGVPPATRVAVAMPG